MVPGGSRPATRRSATLVACLAFALLARSYTEPLAGQQTTLTGVVLDATTGEPVGGALVTVDDAGLRALANAQGRFSITGAPSGAQRIRVSRFGYRELELTVNLTGATAALELRMQVDPVALEGVTVTGGAKADLTGSVLDAVSAKPIPWTNLVLTRDAVRQDRVASSDQSGVFSIDGVVTGTYLMRVERLGYQSQYVQVVHAVPPEPLLLRLNPDSAQIRGLAVMNGELSLRVDSHGRGSKGLDERRIRASPLPDLKQIMEFAAGVPVIPWQDPACGGSPPRPRPNCVQYRGRVITPVVYIDEVRALDVMDIDTYRREDVFRLDYFDCQGLGASIRSEASPSLEIRLYSQEFMKRMAGRPRVLVPPCI
jgi:hypothetical protein